MTEWIQQANPGWTETERLSMRPLRAGDATLFCELYSDPHTMRFVGPPLSWERAQRSFRIALASRETHPLAQLILVMVEKATGQAIGIGGIQHFDARRRRVETGVVVRSESWVQGFGREGLSALVTHAFAVFPVEEVWFQIAFENVIARRMPDSLGLSRNLDTSSYGVAPGQWVWSAHRSSWDRSRSFSECS